MKKILTLLFAVFSFSALFSQSGQWAWMSGDSTTRKFGIYGSKGIPAPENVPGARFGAATWTDASGTLWLFGGYASTSSNYAILNDLWKYMPSTRQWTWINGDSAGFQTGVYGTKGIPASGNKPRARFDPVTWIDASGNLWLFGGSTSTGVSRAIIPLGDLWRYTLSTSTWTWMSGDSTSEQPGVYGTKNQASNTNKPGARYGAACWIDASDNLWLFGGNGIGGAGNPYNELNDLWKYAPASGWWTWISGDSTGNLPGVYGVKGTAAPANNPRSRFGAASWIDTSGNMWLFGGDGFATLPTRYLNDLWKYTPASGWWTWMGGNNTLANPLGTYGSRGTAAPANQPGARSAAVGWTDTTGNMWLFGGFGSGAILQGNLNDLWKYSTASGWWTWQSGDTIPSRVGVYGIKGTAVPANKPGARQAAGKWIDHSNNLWLFGGYGYGNNPNSLDNLNDLWKYSLSTTASLPVQFSSFTARKQQESVLLYWTTAQEQNIRYFIVERSSHGSVYDSIATVAAKGTLSSPASYSFVDKDPLPGTNFYRLKESDRDGAFLYSAAAKVVMDENPVRFTVIQNAVQNTLLINLQLPSAGKVTLQIKDISGQLLLNEEQKGDKGRLVYPVQVSHLAKGTYIIQVQIGTFASSKTFIKQ